MSHKLKLMKYFFYSLLAFTMTLVHVQAQNAGNSDIISIKVVASGKTEALALTEALRSALTQTSSVFISANTTIINDQISKDEIAMINNGSIAGYKLVDKLENADGTVSITYEVTVSVNKLTSFVESTGGATELKGSLFAANIKLQELNEKAEQKAVEDLITVSQTILKNSFDYKIENGEPTEQNGKWGIPLIITITKNKNYDAFVKFFSNSLVEIAMKKVDQDAYLKLNKQLYAIGLFDNSALSRSTPKMLTTIEQTVHEPISALPKDIDYAFYNEHDFSLLANDKKGMETRMKEELRAKQKNWSYQSQMPKYAFTENKTGAFSMIYLRSSASFELINNFVLDIEKNVVNFQINNSLYSFNMLSMTRFRDTRHGQKQSNTSDNAYLSPQGAANLFFGIIQDFSARSNYAFTSGHVFLDKRQSLVVNLKDSQLYGHPCSYKYMPESAFPYPESIKKIGVLRNNVWESKMMTSYMVSNYFVYFDYLFGNYIRYIKAVREINLSYCSVNSTKTLISFPMQLALIGNDSNQVYMIAVTNLLSTDEISRISQYKIDRVQD